MAWRSSGSTNDEMINNLRRFGVISTPTLEQGFRNVDRRFFVPRGHEDVAHIDQPLKDGNIHLSAPHIYGSALEALELQPNSSHSFLNIGSGSGYVSCIAAEIMGIRSSNYGIEIHMDVVNHARNSIDTWKRMSARDSPPIHVIHGNGLDIDTSSGESLVGFDRIYVGAAIERRHLNKITALLRPGGILVGPVDDELVKVVRIGGASRDGDAEDFTQQVLSGVRFAPLVRFPKMETVIPSTVWNPAIHNYYPDSFRASCKEILLCSRSNLVQPRQSQPERQINLAAMLPGVLWLEIMSFTHRSWFEPEKSETAFLRQRLLEEQADAQRAHQARVEAEARCHAAERERDLYRVLANRWQSRLQDLLRRRGGDESSAAAAEQDDAIAVRQDDMEAALDSILQERSASRAIVVSAVLPRFQRENDEDDEEEADEEATGMEEDDVAMLGSHDELDDASADDHNARRTTRAYSVTMEEVDNDDDSDMASSRTTARAIASRPQVRAVSISSDDL